MKIIRAKISLLKHYDGHSVFKPVKIRADAEHDKDMLKSMPLPSAKVYLDCLLNPASADRIKADVLEKRKLLRNLKYRYIDFDRLPLPHLCDIYAELSGLNKEIPFSEPAPAPAEKDSETGNESAPVGSVFYTLWKGGLSAIVILLYLFFAIYAFFSFVSGDLITGFLFLLFLCLTFYWAKKIDNMQK
jgi:hypothetical protein